MNIKLNTKNVNILPKGTYCEKNIENIPQKGYSDNFKRIFLLLSTIIQAKEKILFIASDKKYYNLLKKINLLTSQPFFIGKWIGGYLTNFDKINKEKILNAQQVLLDQCETKVLSNKNEEKKISCILILDPQNSSIAIQEAILLNIPIICFFNDVENIYDKKRKNYPFYASYFFPIFVTKKNEKFVDEHDSFKYFYPILDSIVKTILYCLKQSKN